MKIITLLIAAAFLASCSAPVDLEAEEYAVRTMVLKLPADQADPAVTRVRMIRNIELSPKGDTAKVEGAYIQTPKTVAGAPAFVEGGKQGRFTIEAKKGENGWEVVSDDIVPPPAAASAAP